MREEALRWHSGPGDPSGKRLERGDRRMLWAEGEAGPSDYARRGLTGNGGVVRGRSRGKSGRSRRSSYSVEPSAPPRGRSGIPILSSLLPAFLLPFLPIASAAPPLLRQAGPTPTPPPVVTQRAPPVKRIQYLTSVVTPTSLPTEVSAVDETSLPYVLTQLDDGTWEKVEEGWSLYGRKAGVDAAAASATPSWAIEEALPTGWGQSSNRSNFYKVPLIAVASVILALSIVAGIILIVFHRRKAHRRAKRRTERMRRKALAAAGLTEDGINGSAAQAALKEKLSELEQQPRSKYKKRATGVMVRTKVRSWQGLRRRKGKGQEGEPQIEVIEEEKPVEEATAPHTLHRTSSGSSTDRGSNSSTEPRGSSPEQMASAEESTSQSTESGEAQPPSVVPVEPVSAPYFPPAYRPASVRSLAMDAGTSGPSRPPLAETTNVPIVNEKTRAPGYYPAPTNEESEIALAVVSRSEGKARMPVDIEDEERADRMRHVATDDKLVLEQLRLGASAPLSPPVEQTDGPSIPSAPQIEVDEAGFERITLEEAGPSAPPAPIHQGHLLVPPPPQPAVQRSLGSFGGATSEGLLLDGEHILPSSPPHINPPSAPSAPPMAEDDDLDPSAPPLDRSDGAEEPAFASPPVPSAPTEESVGSDGEIQSLSSIQTDGPPSSQTPVAAEESELSRTSNGPGIVFLPKYEP